MLTGRACSVARALEVMGDPWGFLAMRGLFFGQRRFNEIRDHGAIPRKILASRLKILVREGVVRRRRYHDRPPRYEFVLTQKGRDHYLPAIALMRWGDRWLSGRGHSPIILRHRLCGRAFHAITVCSQCRQEVNIRDVNHRPGPGAGVESRGKVPRSRRSVSPDIYQRAWPCSIARTLGIVADRWLFVIMREACFGVRRFDDFHRATGIARNVLADRLQRLVADDMLQTKRYHRRPERFEYRLSKKCRDLFPAILALLAWGDRWAAGRRGPPLIVTHRTCGRDFFPLVVCSQCREPIAVHDVTYQLNPAVFSKGDRNAPTWSPVHFAGPNDPGRASRPGSLRA